MYSFYTLLRRQYPALDLTYAEQLIVGGWGGIPPNGDSCHEDCTCSTIAGESLNQSGGHTRKL